MENLTIDDLEIIKDLLKEKIANCAFWRDADVYDEILEKLENLENIC